MNAERAGRRILRACVRGEAEVILSIPAKFAVRFNTLFPEATAEILALANGILPSGKGQNSAAKTGAQSFSQASPSWVTTLNEQAAQNNNQVA
jgi:hypothetical protein